TELVVEIEWRGADEERVDLLRHTGAVRSRAIVVWPVLRRAARKAPVVSFAHGQHLLAPALRGGVFAGEGWVLWPPLVRRSWPRRIGRWTSASAGTRSRRCSRLPRCRRPAHGRR